MTAAFAIGGGLLMIAVMSATLPPLVVVPVHGVLLLGSNVSRAAILRKHIDLRTVAAFAVGAVIGATIGSQVVTTLPAAGLRIAIAGFILFTQWGPKISMPTGQVSLGIAGAISTFLTLFVGASGPFITSILSKVERYARQDLIATVGACMSLQHGVKVIVFALLGFAYGPWLPFIAVALVATYLGTAVGAKLLGRMREQDFRFALKTILTVLAIYLLILASMDLFRSKDAEAGPDDRNGPTTELEQPQL